MTTDAPDAGVLPLTPGIDDRKSLHRQGLRAVLFDLDGTLYRQRPVRVRMAAELLTFLAGRPRDGWRAMRVLKAYREAHEALRRSTEPYLQSTHFDVAAEHTGSTSGEVAQIVAEWMFDRPLKHVARHRATGVDELLAGLAERGMRLGVLSDYVAHGKLRALGVDQWFSQVLCAGDPDVRALKPSPRGFLVACERWQLQPAEVLMVGDRVEVDAAGAAAAGMPSVIVGKRRTVEAGTQTRFISSLEQVSRVIDECY